MLPRARVAVLEVERGRGIGSQLEDFAVKYVSLLGKEPYLALSPFHAVTFPITFSTSVFVTCHTYSYMVNRQLLLDHKLHEKGDRISYVFHCNLIS